MKIKRRRTHASNRAELREYVEKELQRVVADAEQELEVVFQGEGALVPISQELWWTIESPDMDQTDLLLARHYLVEARLEEHQFVVWFGSLRGFAVDSPRDVILPAVHIPFPWALDKWAESSPLPDVKERLAALRESFPRVEGVYFGNLRHRIPKGTSGPETSVPQEYSLRAVIGWMLDHETQADTVYDPLVYPMSGCRY